MELGTTYCYRRSGPKRLLMEKSETFQYIPLIENLQWLLQNSDVYDEVSILLVCIPLNIRESCLFAGF